MIILNTITCKFLIHTYLYNMKTVKNEYYMKVIIIPYFVDTVADKSDKIEFDESHIGKYCIVQYDGKPYPGLIQAVDENEVEVNAMRTVGDNRFYWPHPVQDVLWYSAENVLRIIPEPQKVGSRHMQIQKHIWDEIKEQLCL